MNDKRHAFGARIVRYCEECNARLADEEWQWCSVCRDVWEAEDAAATEDEKSERDDPDNNYVSGPCMGAK